MSDNNQWRPLLEVYFAVKRIYTTSEEVDEELKTNLQVFNEFKAALDHIARVKAVDDPDLLSNLSMEDLPADFADQNLRSATSHMYRAFFDTCDSVSISYREKIRESLQGFSKETIAMALPDYYPAIRPRVEEINIEIASMRMNKGQNPTKKKQDIEHYTKLLEELSGYYKKINSAQVSLLEIQRQESQQKREESRKAFGYQVLVPVLCAIGGIVVGAIVSSLI